MKLRSLDSRHCTRSDVATNLAARARPKNGDCRSRSGVRTETTQSKTWDGACRACHANRFANKHLSRHRMNDGISQATPQIVPYIGVLKTMDVPLHHQPPANFGNLPSQLVCQRLAIANITSQRIVKSQKLLEMKSIILSVNAGSSSVKVSVYNAEYGQSPVQLAEAQVSGLTAPPAVLDYTRGGEKVTKGDKLSEKTVSQRDAFGVLLKTLVEDADLPQIGHKDDIGIVCHRIVHGGDYNKAQLISQDTYRVLEGLNDLAPLHNSNSLGIVQACIRDLSSARNVACFDSQFHSTIPPHVRTYPINPDIAQSNKLRKYGFHGISYSFITRASANFLGKSKDKLNLIALHLGSGASACAIKGGRSWDTSMGLTPLAGLPGATRSGSVDPRLAPITHLPTHDTP
jgi:hypothetical protein